LEKEFAAGRFRTQHLFILPFPWGPLKKNPDALSLAVDFPTRLIFFCRAFPAGSPGSVFEN